MGQAVREISTEYRSETTDDFGTKNALARIVRRRWRSNTVKEVMTRWGLTEGEARGVVDATESQRVFDRIIKHRHGGWPLYLEIGALLIGHSIFQWLDRERSRIDEEHRQAAETNRRAVEILRHVRPGPHLVD